ncbi:Coatomer/calthrin adaptor appendage, C-terminal subdomain-containing protein [Lentinula detonsa]|uniref:Coatomer/calthrin adaptor appendage, C-terminal subdomain-containing protein n=1 Tax=Lentinula detonsa TaxID=2804962 RepID=A0AA38PN16_9AGAR|nr:Coatomer/calthrin adaptor appendage, C-terminal subdomain-containing protein [Lentinula detonsa]
MVRVYFVVKGRRSGSQASPSTTILSSVRSAASHTATGAAPTLDVLGSLTGLDWGRTDGPSSSEQPNRRAQHRPLVQFGWWDVQVQTGIKSGHQGHIGQLAIYIGNKVPTPLTSFIAAVLIDDLETLSVLFAKIPPNVIAPRTQELLHVEFKKAFSTPPILTVSFSAGSHQTMSIRLPIVLTKYLDHVKLGQADFFERWKLIGGAPRESHTGRLDLPKFRQAVIGHRFNLLNGIDPNPNNLVGAGVLHTVTSVEGKVGCLLRLDPKEAKLCRLTARTTSEDVAKEAQKLLQKFYKVSWKHVYNAIPFTVLSPPNAT